MTRDDSASVPSPFARSARLSAAMAMVISLALVLVLAPPARAAEGDTQEVARVNLVVFGPYGSDATSIPVLPGLVPTTLTTTIEGGTGAVGSEGTYTLAAGDASATVSSRTGGPVTINLPPETATDGFLPLRLSARIIDEDGCADEDVDDTIAARVREVTITYTGAPIAPTTAADFFSAAVKNIAVVSPPDQATFAAAAVLQAASSLGTAYPRAQISTTAPAPGGPFDRIVDIVPGAGPVVTKIDLVGTTPRMLLTGDPTALVAAAAALGSENLAIASAPEVTDLAQTGTADTSLSLRWADVGSPAPTLEGIGTIDETINIEQIRFGGPVSQLDLRVVGTHLPSPAGANNTITLLVNDRILDSQFLGDNDTFELTGVVGADAIRRGNAITVQVSSQAVGGDCRSATAATRVDIDAAASTITATPGQSLPPGFNRFPQVLGSSLPVSFAKGPNQPDLGNAVGLVASMSRLATNPFTVTVVPVNDFLQAEAPGLLINAGPEESTQLGAPLPYDPVRKPATAPPNFTVTLDSPFAAFEAFATGGRDLLMLGAFPATDPDRAAELQAALATEIAPAPDGWYKLTGDVMFTAGGPKPTYLSLAAATAAADGQDAEQTSSSGVPAWIWVGGLIAALLLGTGAVLWFISRRARNKSSASGV